MISSVYSNPYCKPTKAKKKREQKKKQKVARVYSHDLKERATGAECVFANILSRNNINFVSQRPFMRGDTFAIVDFWLPDYGVIVEIDGGYHCDPAQIKKDEARTADLMRKGKVKGLVRFTNEQVMGDEDNLMKELARNVVPWASRFVR